MTGRSRLADTISSLADDEVSFGTGPWDYFGDSARKN
jgi:hypothetical protein